MAHHKEGGERGINVFNIMYVRCNFNLNPHSNNCEIRTNVRMSEVNLVKKVVRKLRSLFNSKYIFSNTNDLVTTFGQGQICIKRKKGNNFTELGTFPLL